MNVWVLVLVLTMQFSQGVAVTTDHIGYYSRVEDCERAAETFRRGMIDASFRVRTACVPISWSR